MTTFARNRFAFAFQMAESRIVALHRDFSAGPFRTEGWDLLQLWDFQGSAS